MDSTALCPRCEKQFYYCKCTDQNDPGDTNPVPQDFGDGHDGPERRAQPRPAHGPMKLGRITFPPEKEPVRLVPRHPKPVDRDPFPPNYANGVFDKTEEYDARNMKRLSKERLQKIINENAKEHGEEVKDTNPKDAVGIKKVPQSTVSRAVMAEVALAMLEGARKYGRHNYRVAGVRASVYFDACDRHLDAWYEGEDIDPASGLSHIVKAIASLMVLRDCMINDMWEDDRPPPLPDGWLEKLNKIAGEIIEKYPNPLPPHTKDNM